LSSAHAAAGGAARTSGHPSTTRGSSTFARRHDYDFVTLADSAVSAANRPHGLKATITADGLRLDPFEAERDFALSLRLVELARGATRLPMAAGIVDADQERAEIARDGVLEWFVNTELGIEQGFHLVARLGGDEQLALRLVLSLGGSLAAHPDPKGTSIALCDAAGRDVLVYGGLAVRDALGREIPARLEVGPGAVSIVIEDRNAVYPLEVDPLLASAWTVAGGQNGAAFGSAVAAAGDVDGDGYSDVIVGSPSFDGSLSDAGRVFVYRGSASGLATMPAWTLDGDQVGAAFGASVAAGDFDGDGYADVVIGAPGRDGAATDTGKAYVFRGGPSGLAPTPSWTAESSVAGAQFGSSVASAGDVNGDGRDDILVGASHSSSPLFEEGAVNLYLGGVSGPSTIPSWSIAGGQAGAHLGASVARAGDVDGDGYGDVIVGAPGHDGAFADGGRLRVFLGGSSGLASSPAWTVDGAQAGAALGTSVATAGDVNGDGYADVVAGAPGWDAPLTDAGRAVLYLGSVSGLAVTPAWAVVGDIAGSAFGTAVGTAGDVDGDGRADIIVGAPNRGQGATLNAGRVSLFRGTPSGPSSTPTSTFDGSAMGAHFGRAVSAAGDVDGDGFGDVIAGEPDFGGGQPGEGQARLLRGRPESLIPAASWAVEADHPRNEFGQSVASAGDVNGDGYSDLIVGNSLFNTGINEAGRVLVYYGSTSGLSTTPSWVVQGDQAFEEYGVSVASAGDVNGDGYDDMIVGAWMYDNPEADEGRVFVYLGSQNGLATTPAWSADSNQAGAGFGFAVASAGDVNGDGYGDVIVGAHQFDTSVADGGRAFVYLGSATGLAATPVWTASGDVSLGQFGVSVASAGDVNRDGYSDVIVGERRGGQGREGRAYVYLGGPSGPAASPVWVAESNQDGARLGNSVGSAGDVNGDGFSDVIVGCYQCDGPENDEGFAFVYLGSPTGPSPTPNWSTDSNQPFANFGSAVASAGDVNADGYGDVIVSASAWDGAGVDQGRAYLYLGSASGLSTSPAWFGENGSAGSRYGASVASAGDVNGDGFSDVVVGADFLSDGQSEEGGAYAYYGGGGGGLGRRPTQARASGSGPIALRGKSDSSSSFRIRGLGRTAAGRARISMEWDTTVLSAPFGGAPHVTQPTDTGPPTAAGSSAPFDELASSQPTGSVLKWRLRFASTDPYFPRSPWFSLARASITEAKLRLPSCLDADGDGYTPDASCAGGGATDCNDANPAIHPGASETCNGVDDDCDAAIDEGATTAFYLDADADSFGNVSASVLACSPPPGYVSNHGDCNDADGAAWAVPGETLGVVFALDTTILSWDAPSAPGGTAISYDVLESTNAADFVGSATCVESADGTDRQASTSPPSMVGQVNYFLVRARDACPGGVGSLGKDSSAVERSGRVCP
jgi:hypothetical protein